MTTQNTAPIFGVFDGKIDVKIGSYTEATNLLNQQDFKIIVTGYTTMNGGTDFVLARFNSDGSPDISFGNNGITQTSFAKNDGVYSLAIQNDGKILVGGTSDNDFAIARYNDNGSLDTSFSSDGKITSDFGKTLDYLSNIQVQTDGKILVVGTIQDINLKSNTVYSVVMRYDANGNVDNGFDSDGFLKIQNTIVHTSAIQKDGKILLAGYENTDICIIRINPDGSLDKTFGNEGKVITDLGYSESVADIAIQPDGTFLIAGTSNYDFALVKYNSNGSIDKKFGVDGKIVTDFGYYDHATSLVLNSEGKIIVSGYSNNNLVGSVNYALLISKYNNDGTADISFANNGKLTTNFESNMSARDVICQSDDKILIAGDLGSSSLSVSRYNVNGSLDMNFFPDNTLGNLSNFTEGYKSVVLDPDVLISDYELSLLGSYNGANLILHRHEKSDLHDFFTVNSYSTLSELNQNSYFSIDGITIGKVVNNSNGTLELVFNKNATQSLINKALQCISYINTSDAPPAIVQIDWTFNDGNTGEQGIGGVLSVTGSTTVKITPTNDTPIVSLPLVDQNIKANSPFSYSIPSTTFSDPDLDKLYFSVKMYDRTAVPPWLSFDSNLQVFFGTPSNQDIGAFDLQVEVKDSSGASTSDVFRISVLQSNYTPSGTVSITGTPTQNQVLTANNNLADADGLGAISYTWLRDGTAINASTQSTYTLTQADVGKKLSVKASYTDLLGTAESVSSAATTAVANVNDVPTGNVNITGVAAINQTLTANNNLADADGLGAISYTWLRDGIAINTATQSTYTLTQADVGKKLSVKASYTDLLDALENVVSSSVIPVGLLNHLPTGSVTISGTAFKGQVLTASNNLVDTDGLGAISYTWLDNGVVIPNATQSTYKLTQAETGQNISVKASYTDALGTAESAFSSNLVINKNILSTGAATVKGLSTWGTTLSITSTIKDADGIGKLSYIWQNDKITLSTNATYTLADSDIGKQVWAVVSYTDKKGSLEEIKSNVVNVTVSDKASAVNDILTGTEGANKLNGLAGNDTLIGGLGKDSLTGGVGADVFKFNSVNDSSTLPKQADTITDFKHAQSDKIDLSAIDANSVLPNDQAFTLISAATFSADATGQLRFDAKTSTLYGSTNADSATEFAIVLSGVKTLVADDLIL